MNKKNLRDDDDAVSPVVGVILMVAITVIMAAVIGAFVYGYGGSMVQTASPAYTVTRANATHVTITLADMGGASNITGEWIQAPTAAALTIGGTPGSTAHAAATAGQQLILNATVDGVNKVVLNMKV